MISIGIAACGATATVSGWLTATLGARFYGVRTMNLLHAGEASWPIGTE